MGKRAAIPEAIGVALRLLEDRDRDVRIAAACAVGKVGEVSEEVLGAMVRLLGDKDPYVRIEAALALGKLGEAAARPEVLSALAAALRDEAPGVGAAAAGALEGMGRRAATREVLEALARAVCYSWSELVRWKAIRAIGEMGEAAAVDGILYALAYVIEKANKESVYAARVLWRIAVQAGGEFLERARGVLEQAAREAEAEVARAILAGERPYYYGELLCKFIRETLGGGGYGS